MVEATVEEAKAEGSEEVAKAVAMVEEEMAAGRFLGLVRSPPRLAQGQNLGLAMAHQWVI